MNGPHDLGGQHGFGRIPYAPDEPVFHEHWESRVFGMSLSLLGREGPNLDATRHRAERLDRVSYFRNGYYGRWLAAFERMLEEDGLLRPGEFDRWLAGGRATGAARSAGGNDRAPLLALSFVREITAAPAFATGELIVTRNHQPAGHTRLPAYARCRRGRIARVHPAMVFPDTHAHGLGENPQYVYTVAFDGVELWGDTAEPGTCVYLDLFESYLRPAEESAA